MIEATPPEDPAELGVRWCLALLDGLIAGGMRHLVLSPGSRSTPVVLAAQRRPGLELIPILDERSAAFFALGLARASGRTVGLLATSGSAPAHWYPAVVEAEASGVGLILMSADRPPELHGCGANQTIDQTRLFGTRVRAFHDPGPPIDTPDALRSLARLGLRAAAVSQGLPPGPVHLNLPLREPLVPRQATGWDKALGEAPPHEADLPQGRQRCAPASVRPAPGTPSPPPPELLVRLRGRGLIYCGPDQPAPGFAPALWCLADALRAPVLTDPLSGLRFGPAANGELRISRYKSIARNPQAARALRPDWVLRFGRAPVSRTVLEWLAGVPVILIDPAGRWPDPTHDLELHVAAEPTALCESLAQALVASPPAAAHRDWLDLWRQAQLRVERLTTDYLEHAPWCEAQSIRDLVASLPAGDGLLCANSLPIRQLETWAGSREAALRIFGNRGASGIDGQTSTLAGLNAGGVPTTGLVGDLSFLHDLSGLLLAERLDRPLIVLNNGGGRIFDYLPQAGVPDFERLWRTPRPVDLGALARPFGLSHQRVDDATGWRQALAQALAPADTGRQAARRGPLIEVLIDAARSQQVHLEFRRLVATQALIG